MKQIYLDSAATTCLRQEVIDAMIAVLQSEFGNPSSTHTFGRNSKSLIETSRKTIAKYLGCQSKEIIFTSSGTEGTNMILTSCVRDLGIKRIVTSRAEHHATLYTVLHLQKQYGIEIEYVNLQSNGSIDYHQLEQILQNEKPTLVSLMHINNEIGTQLDIQKTGTICRKHLALFHCDTVQSVGKTEFNLAELPVDFIVASAHKFHGPKGVGFAYINKNVSLKPSIIGGEQEKGLRAGTEAVHQIVGMAKAIELAYETLDTEREFISNLKEYTFKKLADIFPETKVNGEDTFYNILNVRLPIAQDKAAMILFSLDIKGIAVSRGSACQSGSVKPSHVLQQILSEEELKKPSLRISFSHYNSIEEIDYFIACLKEV